MTEEATLSRRTSVAASSPNPCVCAVESSDNGTVAPLAPQPVNLVFEGGGAKGVAYVGALKALEDRREISIAAVAGASAGAITAMLVAAGYTSAELREELPKGLEYLGSQIPDPLDGVGAAWKQRKKIRALSRRLSKTGAALDNAGLRSWLARMLAKKLGRDDGISITFRELRDSRELQGKTPIELYVVAANVSVGGLVVFHHEITPRCQVVDAVLASSAIPGALPSAKLVVDESPQKGGERLHTLVDAGVWANFPDFVFKDESFRRDRELGPVAGKVIGLLLQETDRSIVSFGKEEDQSLRPPTDATLRRDRTFRFQQAVEEPLDRTEAVLEAEEKGRSPATWYTRLVWLLFLFGFLLLLTTCAGPMLSTSMSDLLVQVPLTVVAIVLVLWGLSVLPQATQSMASSEHGWPRNHLTNLVDLFLEYLASPGLMIFVWASILVSLGYVILENHQVDSRAISLLAWILTIGLAVLLLANLVALTALAVLKQAVRDWGWGVPRAYFASSGAPAWRGAAAGDHVLRLPVPREISTLSFRAGRQKLPVRKTEDEDPGSDEMEPQPLLPAVYDLSEKAATKQLEKILSPTGQPERAG